MQPKKIFISYSHHDSWLCEEFKRHLSPLVRSNAVTHWYDREIKPGSEFDPIIEEKLRSSNIIVLLVSANFIESNYCYDIEYRTAKNLRSQGKVEIVPVIVRPCYWERMDFERLVVLPDKHVTVFQEGQDRRAPEARDSSWKKVIQGIVRLLNEKSNNVNDVLEDVFSASWENKNPLPTLSELLGGHEQGSKLQSIYLIPELRFGTLDLEIEGGSLASIGLREASLELELFQYSVAPGRRLGDEKDDGNVVTSGGNKWVIKKPESNRALERRALGSERLCTLTVDEINSQVAGDEIKFTAKIKIKVILFEKDLLLDYTDARILKAKNNKKKIIGTLIKKCLGGQEGRLVASESMIKFYEANNED
jgi:hypothetical protein